MKKGKFSWETIPIFLFMAVVVFGGQYFWLRNVSNSDIQTLIGFYSALFTAIAVIIGILAIIGWGWIKELKEKLGDFKKVEDKVNFLNKKEELAEWAKDKVDKLGLSTFELTKMDKEDKEKQREIKDYVINDLTNCGWLELFLAHHFMIEEKEFEKAENILKFIESRDLLDENSKIHSFIYHFLGQLNWEKYYTEKENSKYNYFRSKDEKLSEPSPDEIENAKKLLKKSCENYEKSICYIEKRSRQKKHEHDDRSYANKAIVLIEQYKFYRLRQERDESKDLKDARDILENKIRKKDYNIYYDLARVYYYQKEKRKFVECLNDFKENLELCEKNEKYELKKKHIEYMSEEKKEFEGDGFPGEDFKIQEFFSCKPPPPKMIRNFFKRNAF